MLMTYYLYSSSQTCFLIINKYIKNINLIPQTVVKSSQFSKALQNEDTSNCGGYANYWLIIFILFSQIFAMVLVGVSARPGGDSSEEDSDESVEDSSESDESAESSEEGLNMMRLWEEFFKKHNMIA